MNDKESNDTTFEKREEESTEITSKNKGGNDMSSKTSTGLDQNIAALLCYILGFVSGAIFLLLEKDNQFIRFHAVQSIITFGALFVANFVLTALPVIGWLIGLLLAPVALVLWIVLMVKAYQGEWYKLPLAGDLTEKQLKINVESHQ